MEEEGALLILVVGVCQLFLVDVVVVGVIMQAQEVAVLVLLVQMLAVVL